MKKCKVVRCRELVKRKENQFCSRECRSEWDREVRGSGGKKEKMGEDDRKYDRDAMEIWRLFSVCPKESGDL